MAEKKVRLLGSHPSAYCNRVEIALKLKGVEYEYFEEDIPNNKSPDLLKYNPVHKKIPVLVHGDKGIAESQVILEYIDEAWDSATPILPRDPHQKALARFWARFIDDKLLPSIRRTLWVGEEEGMEEALENLRILDKELEGKRFFGGEFFGFVDIVANSVGYWLSVLEEVSGKLILTEEAFPLIWKWRHEFLASTVVQQTLILIPREILIAKYRAYYEARRARP